MSSPPSPVPPSTLPIRLRRASPRDAAAFARLMAEPAVYANLMQLPFPSPELWEKRLGGDPMAKDFHLVAELEGEIVGSAGLHPAGLAMRRQHVAMLGISVGAAHQGRGVGRALMAALLDYADNWGQVLRTELTVFADNARAIALYEAFGFLHEGRARGYALRNGRYEDVLYMARWHPQPPGAAPG